MAERELGRFHSMRKDRGGLMKRSQRISDADSRSLSESVLCVDLDGTLIRTDLLAESLLLLLRFNVLYLVAIPFWLLRGRARLKREIARRVTIDFERLPYRNELVAFLKNEHARNRHIALVTASDHRLAQGVADHLGLFGEICASDGNRNLKGTRKAALLIERFGPRGFVYAGDSRADLPVWREAAAAIVVGGNGSLLEQVGRQVPIERTFVDGDRMRPRALIRAVRPHQWVKNLLLFVPLITAHRVTDGQAWLHATQAFFAMCLAAAAIYIANDLLDLQADRAHRTKSGRPFASGQLPIWIGLVCIPIFLGGAWLVALGLPGVFLGWLGAYATAALAYSLWLKHVAVVDVLVLAMLYTVRLIAGAAAIGVPMSAWLLAFCMFFFLSLALVKRYEEIHASRQDNGPAAVRGYILADLEVVGISGIASGYMSVLVMALYTDRREISLLYSHPEWLWGFCPLLLFWISRLWLHAHRGEMHDDPILFAAKDWSSYAVLVGLGIFMLLAS
jgi:4-hydroxybenzoate polyprenyltransferase/phosphoserine phosphatase